MVASIISPPLTVQGWILTFSTVFFQAVALVIINNTTGREAAKTKPLLQTTHDAAIRELADLKEVHEALLRSHGTLIGQVHKAKPDVSFEEYGVRKPTGRFPTPR
ncbi:MAG: hypothetical protein M3072_03940 [Candidatus Dormibacteraeota bacterium]|nr:hypothetical protein [Candidatus Dormibacteraeota bacterium]